MKEFGEPSVFSIQYSLKKNPYNEVGVLGESWGELKLWVRGKELCGFCRDSKNLQYTANLIYIIEWLCENLESVFEDDPLNLPVEGDNSLELYKNSLKLKADNELEQDLWFEIRQDWFSRHNWFWNRGGSFLAEVFFRKVEKHIEIAWDNRNTFREEGISFNNPEGIQYVPLKMFQDVIFSFLQNILDELSKNVHGNQELMDMKKKILTQMKRAKIVN